MAQTESDTDSDERITEVRKSLDMASMHELSPELKQKFATAATYRPVLRELWDGSETGLIGDDTSGSGYRASLAARLCEAGDFTAQEYGQLLHNWDFAVQGGDADAKLSARTIARDWVRIGLPRHPSSYFEVLPEPEIDPFTAYAMSEDGQKERAEDTRTVQFDWIDPAKWEGLEPPAREWEVEGWVPKGEITLIYGDGGIGKTLLAHQYATAAAAGGDWLGLPTKQARVMAMFCEDSEDELHRRQRDIDHLLGYQPSDYSANLRIASRKYMDNLLTIWNQHTGEMKRTAVWAALRDDAVRWGATVIIVDTIADTYSGSEIDRAQVNTFVKSCLGRLAQEINGSIIALGHPSMSGMASGNGSSGSTAWSNAARSRLYLRYPKGVETGDTRELAGMKLNYGPKGALLKLKWSRGAFIVTSGNLPGSSSAAFRSIDDMVDQHLREALARLEIRPLSDKPKNVNYAPRVLRESHEPLYEFSIEELEAGLIRIGFQPALWFDKFKSNLAAATEAAAASMFEDQDSIFD
jgi:RecA-family ATPase